MTLQRRAIATAVVLVLWLAGGIRAAPAQPMGREKVSRVELVSPHRLPESLVRSAIGSLDGHPVSRGAVRESLDRLWSLGLFSTIRVDAIREADGVHLRFHLTRRPSVRSVAWTGDPGLAAAILAPAAGLTLGGDASPDRLERARGDLLAEYRKGGFLGAEVGVQTTADPETNARDVTFVLRAGEQAKIRDIRIQGADQFPHAMLMKALGLHAGDRYEEATARAAVRDAEERMHADGFFEARVTQAPPAWDAAANEVALDLTVVEGPRYLVEFTGNVTVTSATVAGNLRVYPPDAAMPGASTINYRSGQTRANSGIFKLSATGQLAVRVDQASGTVHLMLDVNGYIE